MKKIIYSAIGVMALSMSLTSCHDDPTIITPTGDESGTLNLASMSVETVNAEIVINHSDGRSGVDVSNFLVTIKDQNNEAAAPYSWTYKNMPELFTLPVSDNYVVEVESHQIKKAAWDEPYFYGSKTFAIKNGEVTQIGVVEAKFASLKVSVKYSDELKAVMGDDVRVTVKANDEGELVFTPDETRSGYFEVVDGSTTLIASFKGTVDGSTTSYAIPISGIEKGQHRIITYKIKNGPTIPDQTGQIDPSDGIGIDVDVETEDLTGDVDVEEDPIVDPENPGKEGDPDDDNKGDGDDNPGGEDNPGGGGDNPGEDAPAATFEATNSPNLSLDEENTVTATFGNAIVTIKCEKGIKNLWVTIESDSDSFTSALDDLGLAAPFDLAYPGDLEGSLGEDGLNLATGNKVINQTEVPFNITDFVPLLSGFPGHHTFTLKVIDNTGAEAQLVLKFKAL